MVIFQNFKITMDMAGQEDRESLFPIVQVIRDEFFRLMDAIGYGIANAQNVYNMTPTQEHYDIVDWALDGGRLQGVDQSLFFFNPYSDTCPTYFPTRVGVIHNRVGDHCFYIPTELYKDT